MQSEVRLSDVPSDVSVDAWEVVGTVENERLDCKRPDGLTQIIRAMAMTDGGLVVLGVADDRSLIGCPPEPAHPGTRPSSGGS